MKKLKITSVSPGTWVRLVLLIATFTNMTLSMLGKNPIMADGTAGSIASIVMASSTALVSYWKNNSFTKAALQADRVLDEIKNNIS